MVLARLLSNSTPPPLLRAIRAYRKLDLSKPIPVRTPPARPKQARHLTDAELARLVAAYQADATVYELAKEFQVNRHTVSERLKAVGLTLRRTSPTDADIEEMVRLYKSGLSLVDVGHRVNFAARTVYSHLVSRGVQLRDNHGRERLNTGPMDAPYPRPETPERLV